MGFIFTIQLILYHGINGSCSTLQRQIVMTGANEPKQHLEMKTRWGMSVNKLNAKILKTLEGTAHSFGDLPLRFEKSLNHLPAARQGGEGYAAPVLGPTGERYMLKTYHLPSRERKERMTFLTALKLNDLLPAFKAAPVGVVSGSVTPPSGMSIGVEGYLAPFIDGETLEALLNDEWDPDPPERIFLAAQLCSAIQVLESGGLVHADLAMSNVMVMDADTDVPELRLIDFDGFHHEQVPVVPCSDERGGRGFGQDAYRHSVYQAMNDSVTVTSDRCAMAALLLELVALKPKDVEHLGRSTVLSQDDINAGQPSTLPQIIDRWPEGWQLLRSAFLAPCPEDAPTPSVWYDALVRLATRHGVNSGGTPSSRRTGLGLTGLIGGYPIVTLRIIEGEDGGIERRVNLRGAGNNFTAVSTKLAWLSYSRTGKDVILHGQPMDPNWVMVRRNGKLMKYTSILSLTIEPGDEIRWGDFEILVG